MKSTVHKPWYVQMYISILVADSVAACSVLPSVHGRGV